MILYFARCSFKVCINRCYHTNTNALNSIKTLQLSVLGREKYWIGDLLKSLHVAPLKNALSKKKFALIGTRWNNKYKSFTNITQKTHPTPLILSLATSIFVFFCYYFSPIQCTRQFGKAHKSSKNIVVTNLQ